MRWQFVLAAAIALVVMAVAAGYPLDEAMAQACRRNNTCG